MSELQISLLVIGVGAIVAVYAFGWWQQRRYRRKFGTAFKAGHADALYQDSNDSQAIPAQQPVLDEAISVTDTAIGDSGLDTSSAALSIDLCELLDARSDFIVELHLDEPGPPAVLNGLWFRKFDFGKPVQVCGLTLGTKKWERAISEGHTLYAGFRIALQLVDRGGVVSEAKLADFRDLVLGIAKHIKADTTVPDLKKSHHQAVELDAFCADVDQMVGVNLVSAGERFIRATNIAQSAAFHGMTLEADGAFHLLNVHGQSVFSLSNQNSVPFQYHTLETFSTAGITLLLDVPRVENPCIQFDQMMHVARELAKELRATVVDDHRVVLSDNGLALIRARIAGVEAKMSDHGFEPGSAQALRLFS